MTKIKKYVDSTKWTRVSPYQRLQRRKSVRRAENFDQLHSDWENRIRKMPQENNQEVIGNNSNSTGGDEIQNQILEVVNERQKLLKFLKPLSLNTAVNRKILSSLVSQVNRYTTLKDLERKYADLHDE